MKSNVNMMTFLVEKLSRQPEIAALDAPEKPSEAETLAHALCDMQESFAKYMSSLLPRLLVAKDEEVIDCLQEIGEELRHIAYHMCDPKFFACYVGDLVDGDTASSRD